MNGKCGFMGASRPVTAPVYYRPLAYKVQNGKAVLCYLELCEVMKSRQRVQFVDGVGAIHQGMINGLSPEDGSGRSWIVTVCKRDNSQPHVWVRAE